MQTKTKTKTSPFFLFLFSFILILSSCKRSTEPLYNTANLQLQVLDVSCTEAWLLIRTKLYFFIKYKIIFNKWIGDMCV